MDLIANTCYTISAIFNMKYFLLISSILYSLLIAIPAYLIIFFIIGPHFGLPSLTIAPGGNNILTLGAQIYSFISYIVWFLIIESLPALVFYKNGNKNIALGIILFGPMIIIVSFVVVISAQLFHL